MSQNAQEYWTEVKQERLKIFKYLLALPPSSLQPKDRDQDGNPTVCYVTSRRNRDRGTSAGHVVLVNVGDIGIPGVSNAKLGGSAAKLIVDSTHELSTEEEIKKFVMEHQKRRAEAEMLISSKENVVDAMLRQTRKEIERAAANPKLSRAQRLAMDDEKTPQSDAEPVPA